MKIAPHREWMGAGLGGLCSYRSILILLMFALVALLDIMLYWNLWSYPLIEDASCWSWHGAVLLYAVCHRYLCSICMSSRRLSFMFKQFSCSLHFHCRHISSTWRNIRKLVATISVWRFTHLPANSTTLCIRSPRCVPCTPVHWSLLYTAMDPYIWKSIARAKALWSKALVRRSFIHLSI